MTLANSVLPGALFVDAAGRLISLHPVDMAIIAIYFAVVLGIGVYLKRYATSGEDFFMAGREMTAWVAGLSFISANLGAIELLGWAGAAYEYGIQAAHAYWIAAFPAIVILALVMMPFYYLSKTHSVPGYLQLRYGESTRALSGISFAVMTILMSGINMYAMALVMKVVLGWNLHFSILISSVTVAVYVVLGGLFSAIFNEVLQFFLIWVGALLIPILGLVETGGWSGLVARIHQNFPGVDYTHLWKSLGSFTDNPMGVHWTGVVFGMGFAIACGYWTTDFLVVQRIMAAKDLRAAKTAPIIGAYFKMAVPLIVILPGLLGLAVLPFKLVPADVAGPGMHSYNELLPLMLARYCGPGLLGLGITALIAGFMSGMAGNVSAFATVWTYDIYRPYFKKQASDAHYVLVGRWSTILGVIVSIVAAYFVTQFKSIMDYMQALVGFFISPLFGVVLLGMLWKRATSKGGFWGMLSGTVASVALFTMVKLDPKKIAWVAFSSHAKDMAENYYRATWSLVITIIVLVVVSLFTEKKPDAELENLVYGCTIFPSEADLPVYKSPWFWGIGVGIVFAVLQWIFW